jgi:hypothetical protein
MFDWPANKKIFKGGAAEAACGRKGRRKSRMATRAREGA